MVNLQPLFDTASSARQALLGSPKKLCAAFILLFAMPALIFTVNAFNIHYQDNRVRQNADLVSHNVGERIGVINTVLASMAGLHDVEADLDNEKLLRFSSDILRNNSYIRNLGRYERIEAGGRDAFEAEMSHNGYSGFSIAQIDDDGRFQVRPAQDLYYPVSIAGPLYATVSGVVGTDLGSLDGVRPALESLSDVNSSTAIALPSNWPLRGDLITLRPTFSDTTSHKYRSPQSHYATGGFWLTVDSEQLLEGLSEVVKEFDVSIELVNFDERKYVYETQSNEQSSQFLTQFFSKQSSKEVWFLSPSSQLVITLEKDVGLSLVTLLIAAIAAGFIILISCLYTVHVINKRRTEIERTEGLQTLFKEREKAEKTLNSVQDSIITLDPELNVVHINPAAIMQFNTRASLVIGKPLTQFAQFHRTSHISQLMDIGLELATLTHNGKKEIDVVPAGQSEEDFVLRMALSSSHDHEGLVTGHVLVLRDISHECRLSKKLAYQANYDALTGCTNRYFFEQSLDRLISEMPATGLTHTLCYMDLDQFKIVNDTCGHRAGDQLLIELTKNMQMMIRDQDILSRLGGDEFGLILVGVNHETATQIAQRVYEFFQKFNFTHQGNTFSVTASIGVVHIDSTCANSKDIMASADIACYAAKDSGRNSMSVYSKNDENMAERSEELNWLPRLQTALHNNEFRLHAQAVASLNPGPDAPPITHFEFLLRLANKDGTEVTPWQFIQAAERYDLMRDIDRWVISNALEHVAQNATGAAGECSFSINLSGQSAADPTLKSFIQNQIALHKVDPCRIWFELTETAAISHFSIAVDLIKSIRSTGAKVALDDFGSGLSSFGYLKNLPVDIIKIDGQFIKEIVKNPIDREMVRAIHRVGESMNIETVAEFVENQAIVDELKLIGVNYAQGYHIGKPVPVAQAIALLTQKPKAA